jgi:DNA-binding NtrC family response regulator
MPKIIVVDNDEKVRKNIIRMLKKDGWEIEDAASQVAAINLIKKNQYDVVVTDMLMENETSGLSVLEAAKKRNKFTKGIVISTSS